MSVWWLAINANQGHCFYKDLKAREAIAQGWPALGDVGYVLRMPRSHVEDELRRKLIGTYSEFQKRLPKKLFTFLRCIEPDDLVVGVEGTTVRGLCRMPQDFSYHYEPDWNYAHAFRRVKWVDWERFSPDWSPQSSGQGFLAVAQMHNDAARVERLARAFWR